MNKNSRSRRSQALKALARGRRVGQTTVSTTFEIDQTMSGHNMGKRNQVISVGGKETSNTWRNLCQRVFVNVGADGKMASITRHVPLENGCVIRPKNHGYLEYRQPIGAR